jgi:biotin carboxyl carrier protein
MAIYQVTIGGKAYQVEIEDVNARPVRAVVNGQVVQVWVPEQGQTPLPTSAPPAPTTTSPTAKGSEAPPSTVKGSEAPPSMPTVVSPPAAATQPGVISEWEVRAPMPGSIVSLSVRPGDQVEAGQDLCVLDAMKMNNRIRAARAGTIAQIHVSPGQQVQYGDPLMSFTEESEPADARHRWNRRGA